MKNFKAKAVVLSLVTAVAALFVATMVISAQGNTSETMLISVDAVAPNFTLRSIDEKSVELASFKGKYVVLEWTNYDCPFVVKHYSSGNMQSLQKKYTEKDVVWLTINSSAPGKQGHFPAAKWKELAEERKSYPTAILLDPDGQVGRLYQAKTTPHIFIISPEGKLLYMGAIDDNPSRKIEDIETSKNYVQVSLDKLLEGKPLEENVTRPYGCSVKY